MRIVNKESVTSTPGGWLLCTMGDRARLKLSERNFDGSVKFAVCHANAGRTVARWFEWHFNDAYTLIDTKLHTLFLTFAQVKNIIHNFWHRSVYDRGVADLVSEFKFTRRFFVDFRHKHFTLWPSKSAFLLTENQRSIVSRCIHIFGAVSPAWF